MERSEFALEQAIERVEEAVERVEQATGRVEQAVKNLLRGSFGKRVLPPPADSLGNSLGDQITAIQTSLLPCAAERTDCP